MFFLFRILFDIMTFHWKKKHVKQWFKKIHTKIVTWGSLSYAYYSKTYSINIIMYQLYPCGVCQSEILFMHHLIRVARPSHLEEHNFLRLSNPFQCQIFHRFRSFILLRPTNFFLIFNNPLIQNTAVFISKASSFLFWRFDKNSWIIF